MSLNISSYASSGAFSILNQGIKNIESQQADVAWQSSQGTVSDSISGLGDVASSSIKMSAKLSEISGYQNNLTSVQNRLKMSASALTQITSIAQDLSTQVLGMMSTQGESTSGTATVATSAQKGLSSLANILNTNDGNGYIFSGNDTNTKPISNTDDLMDSDLGKSIQKLVDGLDDGNSFSLMNSATDLAADNSQSPFSKQLSVSATDAQNLQTQAVIGSNGQTASTGPVATQGTAKTDSSTGSPIRDLMRDMMVAASLNGKNGGSPGYENLVKNLHNSIQNTVNSLIDMNTSVGVQQQTLTKQQGVYTTLSNMTQSQLSNNLDVDASTVATRSNDLQTQLKASFMLISQSKGMTLANYI